MMCLVENDRSARTCMQSRYCIQVVFFAIQSDRLLQHMTNVRPFSDDASDFGFDEVAQGSNPDIAGVPSRTQG